MRSLTIRASVSVDPPAGNGTTNVIGRAGKLCAAAPTTVANSARSAAAKSFLMELFLSDPDPSRGIALIRP